MTNYKPFHTSFNIGGQTIPIPELATVKLLTDRTNLSSAADSATDLADNLVYSVPTGKTFHLIGMRLVMGADITSNILLYEGATENAETTLKSTILLPSLADWGHNYEWYFIDVTFAAGTFIVLKPTASVEYTWFLGYEI